MTKVALKDSNKRTWCDMLCMASVIPGGCWQAADLVGGEGRGGDGREGEGRRREGRRGERENGRVVGELTHECSQGAAVGL